MWHINDLKVIHKSKNIVSIMVKCLNKTYRVLFEYESVKMKISRGKIHEYLCVTLDFSEPVEVNISMIPYTSYIFEDFANHDYTMNISANPA